MSDTAQKSASETQEGLPYKWSQTLGEVSVTVEIPVGTKAKDLDVVIAKTRLKAGLKGQPPIIEVRAVVMDWRIGTGELENWRIGELEDWRTGGLEN